MSGCTLNVKIAKIIIYDKARVNGGTNWATLVQHKVWIGFVIYVYGGVIDSRNLHKHKH